MRSDLAYEMMKYMPLFKHVIGQSIFLSLTYEEFKQALRLTVKIINV